MHFSLNVIASWIDAIPAVVRILLVFALVLPAIRRGWSLGSAFLAGAASLGLIFSMGPVPILRSAAASLVHPQTVSLAVVVSFILVFSHALEKSGQMTRLLESFKGLVRRPKISLVIFPALIGLLPMPGGAIFSAPMVKSLGRGHPLSVAQLSYINYWFRHIWEYWWPLYPGILLTTALAGIDVWRLVVFTAPLSVVAVAVGYWPLRGAMQTSGPATGQEALKPFLLELAPIAGVIVMGLLFGVGLGSFGIDVIRPMAKELGLMAALLIAIFWVWRHNRISWPARWAIVKDRALLKMVYMVAAILVFKGILEDSRAVDLVSGEMLRWHIPLLPIAMLLPFLVGMVGGITIAFVGTTFPIVISLIQAMDQEALMLPYLMLGLSCGFIGVLVSPLHLCLMMSNAYFKTTLAPVYRLMRVPLLAMAAAATAYFWLLRWFMI
jgi:uncharacterized protein